MFKTGNLKFAVNLSLLFPHVPLNERAQLAVDAGFKAAEIWWPFSSPRPADAEVDAFINAMKSSGISLIGMNFCAGDMPAGDRGLISDPTRVEDFKASVDVLVKVAKALGTRKFNLLYGNVIEGLSAEEQEKVARANVAYAQEKVAKALRGTILIEQCNPRENTKYRLPAPDDAVKVVTELNAQTPGTLGLLADVYHWSEYGADALALLIKHYGIISHVQIADSPGRNEPGTGSVNFQAIFDYLIEKNYDGYIGMEYRPKADTVEGLSWLR